MSGKVLFLLCMYVVWGKLVCAHMEDRGWHQCLPLCFSSLSLNLKLTSWLRCPRLYRQFQGHRCVPAFLLAAGSEPRLSCLCMSTLPVEPAPQSCPLSSSLNMMLLYTQILAHYLSQTQNMYNPYTLCYRERNDSLFQRGGGYSECCG